mmetsp:Transcript_88816/g.108645  ORF Transcript_88816/g.108645 Transcript_88816/m.108645 type:complete len:269 (-) Transcript_88816:535-1341(-)
MSSLSRTQFPADTRETSIRGPKDVGVGNDAGRTSVTREGLTVHNERVIVVLCLEFLHYYGHSRGVIHSNAAVICRGIILGKAWCHDALLLVHHTVSFNHFPHGPSEILIFRFEIRLLHLAIQDIVDPIQGRGDPGIDPWIAFHATTFAPAGDTPHHKAALLLTDQGTTTVPLTAVCDAKVRFACGTHHVARHRVILLGISFGTNRVIDQGDRRLLQAIWQRSRRGDRAPARDDALGARRVGIVGQARGTDAVGDGHGFIQLDQRKVAI